MMSELLYPEQLVRVRWFLLQRQETVVWFILRPCQPDDDYIDGRSKIQVHTDERTQVHGARSSLVVTDSSTNRSRRALTSVNVPLS